MLMRTPASTLPAPRYPSIQILRAVAALAIVFHHGLHEADGLAKRLGGSFAHQYAWPLEAGVDLFFVVSGFVMVVASRDLFGTASSIWPFLRRRLARVVPIYWAVLALYGALLFTALVPLNRPLPTMGEMAASFAFIPYQRPDGFVQPVYGLGWTLNYEMLFYAVFALCLPLKRSLAVPVILGLLMVLMAIGTFVPPSQTAFHFWTRPIILEFGLGVMIGQMTLDGLRPARRTGALLAAAALAWLVLGGAVPDLIPRERVLLYGLPAALLVLAGLAFDDLLGGRPELRPLVALGDASYALYLLHPFVLRALTVGGGAALVQLSPWLFLVVGAALSCWIALMVWRGFERPLTRALQGSKPV
jgi:exopolysaccharide production protein ExoZ